MDFASWHTTDAGWVSPGQNNLHQLQPTADKIYPATKGRLNHGDLTKLGIRSECGMNLCILISLYIRSRPDTVSCPELEIMILHGGRYFENQIVFKLWWEFFWRKRSLAITSWTWKYFADFVFPSLHHEFLPTSWIIINHIPRNMASIAGTFLPFILRRE